MASRANRRDSSIVEHLGLLVKGLCGYVSAKTIVQFLPTSVLQDESQSRVHTPPRTRFKKAVTVSTVKYPYRQWQFRALPTTDQTRQFYAREQIQRGGAV